MYNSTSSFQTQPSSTENFLDGGRFAKLPEAFLSDSRLGLWEWKVYAALRLFARSAGDGCYPKRGDIQKVTGLHPRNISKATARLERFGWVIKSGNGGRSMPLDYILLDEPDPERAPRKRAADFAKVSGGERVAYFAKVSSERAADFAKVSGGKRVADFAKVSPEKGGGFRPCLSEKGGGFRQAHTTDVYVDKDSNTNIPENTLSKEFSTNTDIPENTFSRSKEFNTNTDIPENTFSRSKEFNTNTDIPENTFSRSKEFNTNTDIPENILTHTVSDFVEKRVADSAHLSGVETQAESARLSVETPPKPARSVGGKKRARPVLTASPGLEGFAEFRSAYPKRDGDQNWKGAEKAWCARRNEGHTAAEMIAGAAGYREYLVRIGRVGTVYVKQAATFLGPSCVFDEYQPAKPALDRNGAEIRISYTGREVV